MIVRAGILTFCATGTGTKAYLQQQDPYCWVMKQMFLYTGVGDLLCVESTRRECQLVEAAEHLPGFAQNCVLGAKEMEIFTTSVLITLREITNHASKNVRPIT